MEGESIVEARLSTNAWVSLRRGARLLQFLLSCSAAAAADSAGGAAEGARRVTGLVCGEWRLL